jgi:hypothetical protein
VCCFFLLFPANPLSSCVLSRVLVLSCERPDRPREQATGRTLRVMKGSPQTLLALGRFDEATVTRVNEAVDALAKRGFRSLGVITQQEGGAFSFHGIVSLYDPPV